MTIPSVQHHNYRHARHIGSDKIAMTRGRTQ